MLLWNKILSQIELGLGGSKQTSYQLSALPSEEELTALGSHGGASSACGESFATWVNCLPKSCLQASSRGTFALKFKFLVGKSQNSVSESQDVNWLDKGLSLATAFNYNSREKLNSYSKTFFSENKQTNKHETLREAKKHTAFTSQLLSSVVHCPEAMLAVSTLKRGKIATNI